jgi:hypothetical protein
MQVASRPRLNAGIALVGASVVAVCPLAPQMPDVHLPSVQSAAVELAALSNAIAAPVVSPIEQWTQVVQAAITNLGALGQQLAADPAPILQQILANQSADGVILGNASAAASTALTTAAQALPAALQTAAKSLEAGDVTGAVAALTGPVIPLALGLVDAGFNASVGAWNVVANETQNFANVVAAVPQLPLSALLAVASPLISDINASADIGQAIADAGTARDLEGVVTALVNAPATLTGATLNGYGTNPILGTPEGGLLSGVGEIPGITDGTIAGLLALRDTIAKALAPAAAKSFVSTAPAALTAAATTVTLATAPVTKAIAAPATDASKLVNLPKLHLPVKPPRTLSSGTTGTGAAATDATATATGGAAVKAAVANVSAGITKAVSGGTGKSSASAGKSSAGKSAGSSKGSGGGGRHRK